MFLGSTGLVLLPRAFTTEAHESKLDSDEVNLDGDGLKGFGSIDWIVGGLVVFRGTGEHASPLA